MADNVTIPASGTGDATPKVATDQLAGGEHVQYVKIMDGTLDGAGKVAGDAANGLDVDVTRVSGNVTVVQATPANLRVDASGVAVPVTDNAGSLTVDAPVGTPVFARLSDGAAALVGQKAMAASLPVVVASDQATFPVTATLAAASDATKAEDAASVSGDRGMFVLGVRDDTLGTTATTSANGDYAQIALDHIGRLIIRETPADNIGTTISAANTTVTLTLAAAGAGLKHYITRIHIVNINASATAITGSTSLAYTTTNIPGSLAWTAGNALAIGEQKVVTDEVFGHPIKTTTANTATTIVAPAIGAGGVCRITAHFYIAP